jgi:hypothetical protein
MTGLLRLPSGELKASKKRTRRIVGSPPRSEILWHPADRARRAEPRPG